MFGEPEPTQRSGILASRAWDDGTSACSKCTRNSFWPRGRGTMASTSPTLGLLGLLASRAWDDGRPRESDMEHTHSGLAGVGRWASTPASPRPSTFWARGRGTMTDMFCVTKPKSRPSCGFAPPKCPSRPAAEMSPRSRGQKQPERRPPMGPAREPNERRDLASSYVCRKGEDLCRDVVISSTQSRPLGVSTRKINAPAVRPGERKVLARGHRVGRPRDARRQAGETSRDMFFLQTLAGDRREPYSPA